MCYKILASFYNDLILIFFLIIGGLQNNNSLKKCILRESLYLNYLYSSLSFNTAMNASWGTSTAPTIFIRFLPSFCFSSNFRFLVTSPPYNLAVTSLRTALIVERAVILLPIAA